MGKIIIKFFEYFPSMEILVRCFLWRFPKIKQMVSEFGKRTSVKGKTEPDSALWGKVKEQIRTHNIKKDDILLVHSSMDGLAKAGVSAKEVIDFLLELVGEEGTLVFASYPQCKKYGEDADVLYYDPKRTVSWTGLLPNVFCKYKGVIRSEFPYNTLAAKGPLAEEMMKNNLVGDTSQGPYSAWKYCVEHHAKILYLGVSAALSCTMMNYPEDALEDDWYVDNWYYEQKYAIKLNGEIVYKTIKERDPEWYRFYAMFYSERWMIKNNFLNKEEIDGVYIGVTDDMGKLADKLLELGKQRKSVYRIPKKYWKR